MESGDGVELLLDVGLDRRVTASAEVEIGTGDGRWSRRQVLLWRHSPSPQEIARAVTGLRPSVDGVIFVVERAGRALARTAEQDHRVAHAAALSASRASCTGLKRNSRSHPPVPDARAGLDRRCFAWSRSALWCRGRSPRSRTDRPGRVLGPVHAGLSGASRVDHVLGGDRRSSCPARTRRRCHGRPRAGRVR